MENTRINAPSAPVIAGVPLEIKEQIYAGSSKLLFRTNHPDTLSMRFTDMVSVGDTLSEEVQDKGRMACLLNEKIFTLLTGQGVPNHFLRSDGDRQIYIKKAVPFPLKIKVRNYAAGSFTKKTGIQEGMRLKQPVLDFVYKDKERKEPMLNGYYILAMELATQSEIDKMVSIALKVNEILIDFFGRCKIDLIDCKMEFGRYQGEVVLIDAVLPDSCRLWDKETHERLDADRIRLGLGNLSEAYAELAKRIR